MRVMQEHSISTWLCHCAYQCHELMPDYHNLYPASQLPARQIYGPKDLVQPPVLKQAFLFLQVVSLFQPLFVSYIFKDHFERRSIELNKPRR
jgi:hypothetical protein